MNLSYLSLLLVPCVLLLIAFAIGGIIAEAIGEVPRYDFELLRRGTSAQAVGRRITASVFVVGLGIVAALWLGRGTGIAAVIMWCLNAIVWLFVLAANLTALAAFRAFLSGDK